MLNIRGRYGSESISKEFEHKGISTGRKRVAKLMRMDGLYPKSTPNHYEESPENNGKDVRIF